MDWASYGPLLSNIASYGFVVACTRSCNAGCKERCANLTGDPPCFGNYYEHARALLHTTKPCSIVPDRRLSLAWRARRSAKSRVPTAESCLAKVLAKFQIQVNKQTCI